MNDPYLTNPYNSLDRRTKGPGKPDCHNDRYPANPRVTEQNPSMYATNESPPSQLPIPRADLRMAYRYLPETHGVQPVYDPALDDGGGLGPQLQGNGTGAPNRRNSPSYYELNGNMHQNSPGFPSMSSLGSYSIYSSPPNENQVLTNAIQTNLPFDLYSGFPFLPNHNSLAIQAPSPLLYHQYPPPNEESLSMDLHNGAHQTGRTPDSNGPSMREGNRWDSVSSSDSFYNDSNHLDHFTLGGPQDAVASVHPGVHYNLAPLIPAPVYLPHGIHSHQLSSMSHSPYQNGQIQNLPNHTSTLFDFEGNSTQSYVALSQLPVMPLDRGTEQETASRLNNYTSSNVFPIYQANRLVSSPYNDCGSIHQTNNFRSIDDSEFPVTVLTHADQSEASHGSSSARNTPSRKRKKSSKAVVGLTKSKSTSKQCHLRPLRPDQIDQVQNVLRPWFHNKIRCDTIPLELYRGMFKMIDGKEFCAIRGCTFESTHSRRRPGLKYEHANRHLNHKPLYCETWDMVARKIIVPTP